MAKDSFEASGSFEIQYWCVECGEAVQDLVCGSCGKTYELIDGVPCFLCEQDEKSSLFKRYFDSYSRLAQDNLVKEIMPPFYKDAQSEKLVRYAGKKIAEPVSEV